MAEQRIKGPVTLLSPPLINQSGGGIVLSQPLGAAHVRMRGGAEWEGLVVEEEEPASQPVSAVDCSSISAAYPMTRRPCWGEGVGGTTCLISPNGLLFCTTSAMPITIPWISDPP